MSKLTRKDFVPPVDVRWCPSCGDYSILNSIQKTFPDLGIPRENFVVVSGIGCSSRFPYYMETYGFHTIHGRAPTVATGIKVANPDLSVWLVTGDGDGLSIGGNHLLHVLRRNLDVNILLFNNRIYGLTKGQYSPTSGQGKVTKTSPLGSIDQPINPLCIALAAESTFVARTIDTNPKHMVSTFKASAAHKGISFVEIFQNCLIFNNKEFENIAGREVREDLLLMLEHGKPLIFGKEKNKGIRLNGLKLEVVTIGENGVTEEDILVHNAEDPDPTYAYLLTQMKFPDFPTPMGIFRNIQDRPTYEESLEEQMQTAKSNSAKLDYQALINGSDSWVVEGDGISASQSASEITDNVSDEMTVMKEMIQDEKKSKRDPFSEAFHVSIGSLLEKYGTTKLLTVKSTDGARNAIKLLRDKRIGSLPVIDGEELIGIVSERDIFFKVVGSNADRDKLLVKDIMSQSPETVSEETTVAEAIHKLSLGRFRHMPVKTATGWGMISSLGLVKYIHSKTSK